MTPQLVGKRIICRVLALALASGGLVPMSEAATAAVRAPQCGMASWHDPSRGERRTASDRPWVGTEMVAAHRSLPLGSKVRVVNLANGRAAVVEITDRGPYRHGRIIDVSRCAAQQLGLIEAGTARVRLEMLTPEAVDEVSTHQMSDALAKGLRLPVSR